MRIIKKYQGFSFSSGLGVSLTFLAVGCANPLGGFLGRGGGSGSQTSIDSGFHPGVSDAAPTLVSVAPASGPQTGGTPLSLIGTGFAPGIVVLVGGTPCLSTVVVSALKITCLTPVHASGPVSIKVTNPDAKSVTLASAYTYTTTAPPGSPVTAIVLGGGHSGGLGISAQATIGEPTMGVRSQGVGISAISSLKGTTYTQ